jgi:hypothetical protein
MGCAGILMTLLPAGYRRASMPEDRGAIERGSRIGRAMTSARLSVSKSARESIPRWPGFLRIRAFSSARTLEGRRTGFLEPGFLEHRAARVRLTPYV